MVALRAQFDGEKIVLPDELRGRPPQEVIVMFDPASELADSAAWMKAQEQSFTKAWDNDEDAAYDDL